MIHEDILKRVALASGVDPTTLAEPWPPRSIAFEDEQSAPEPQNDGERA